MKYVIVFFVLIVVFGAGFSLGIRAAPVPFPVISDYEKFAIADFATHMKYSIYGVVCDPNNNDLDVNECTRKVKLLLADDVQGVLSRAMEANFQSGNDCIQRWILDGRVWAAVNESFQDGVLFALAVNMRDFEEPRVFHFTSRAPLVGPGLLLDDCVFFSVGAEGSLDAEIPISPGMAQWSFIQLIAPEEFDLKKIGK